MKEEVLINVGIGETRVAVVSDEQLDDIIFERTIDTENGKCGHTLIGNIYLGRVQRVLPGMQAAFVDVGLERAGFLGAREARCLAELPGFSPDNLPKITECVHEGEAVLVQVVKDPIGEKGARLSANLTLAGRLLVLVPNQSGVALSRRIEEEPERERLTALVQEMIDELDYGEILGDSVGYIVRTAAIGASADDIAEDARRLCAEWKDVQVRRGNASIGTVLYTDMDPVSRALRDCVGPETDRVLIDDGEAFAAAKRYCEMAMPDKVDLLERYNGSGCLFDLYEIEDALEQALEPRVSLPSGGWITIETTEALTAIDVNSGSYTAATGLEETSVRTNMEAADAIVRQIRLRGTGGLIVIDFIHMENQDNIDRLLERLKLGFARDRVPTQISGMSEFGLVEMTRKRIREPLSHLLTEHCRPCDGFGRIKTVETVAHEILRRLRKEAAHAPGRSLVVHAAPEVVAWFNSRSELLQEIMGKRFANKVSFKVGQKFGRQRYDVGLAED